MEPDTASAPTASQVRDADLAALENIAGIGMRGWAAMQVYQPEAKQSRSQRQTMHDDSRESRRFQPGTQADYGGTAHHDLYTTPFHHNKYEEDVYPRHTVSAATHKSNAAALAPSSLSASSINSSLASTDSGASLS